MYSFVIRPTTWPVLRIFSRNPLMRKSDRIEAALIPLAVFLVILAVAGAGVLGTLAHDIEARRYLDETRTRHTVTATAVEDSTPGPGSASGNSKVVVRWRASGVDRSKLISWGEAVRARTPLQIWVDAEGYQVEAPRPPSLAGANAVLAGAVAWWILFLVAEVSVGAVRSRLSRIRDTQWDREIRYLLDDSGGRANHSQ